MSALVFPTYLLGRVFTHRKTPKFKTLSQKSVTGKTSRLSLQPWPLYEWDLEYEFLRDGRSRTNYVSASQDWSQWGPSHSGVGFNAVVTPNYAIAPDGTLTAARVVLNKNGGSTSSDYSIVSAACVAPPPLTANVASLWMKTNDGSTVGVDVQVSYMGSNTFTVTPQWQRFSFPCTGFYSGGGYGPSPGIFVIGSHAGDSQYADLAAWGFQLEPGITPGALVPTYNGAVIASDLKTLAGLFNQMLAQSDTFLYLDPDFNTVSWQPFGTGNGTQTSWPLTVAYTPGGTYYQDYKDGGLTAQSSGSFPIWSSPNFGNIGSGFAGLPELVQNPVDNARIYIVRYGTPEMLNYSGHTNLILQSQNMATASWTANGSGTGLAPTVTANFAIAPDGTTTATRIQYNRGGGNTSSDYSQVFQAVASTAGTLYTSSVWLRSNDGLTHNLSWYTNGAVASGLSMPTITITPTWQRFYFSYQAIGTNVFVDIRTIGAVGNDNTADILMWGAQLETGSYATRYLPTTTSTVSVGAEVSVSLGTVSILPGLGAPANGVPLLWSGSFRYRCRFSEDSIDFVEFMQNLWELKQLKFEQVIV